MAILSYEQAGKRPQWTMPRAIAEYSYYCWPVGASIIVGVFSIHTYFNGNYIGPIETANAIQRRMAWLPLALCIVQSLAHLIGVRSSFLGVFNYRRNSLAIDLASISAWIAALTTFGLSQATRFSKHQPSLLLWSAALITFAVFVDTVCFYYARRHRGVETGTHPLCLDP